MADKNGKLLSAIPGIPTAVVTKLAAYWITTAEELLGTAVEEGGIPGLMSITGLSQDDVVRLIATVHAALPPTVSFTPGSARPHGLGALDEANPSVSEAPRLTPKTPLPPSVDLHSRFGPPRDQGMRGTCVAHACTAVREFLTGPQSDLSEQFLYWDCKKHDLIPTEGTLLSIAMGRLEFDGIVKESDWPYSPTPIPGNLSQDPPPAGILTKATPNRIASFNGLSGTSIDGLCQALASSSVIAIAVPVYTNWFTEPTNTTGDVRMPLPSEKLAGGHALCMVGYTNDPGVPGGGYFILRNSWGPYWAAQSAVAPGYARVPFAYIHQFGKSAYTAVNLGPTPTPSNTTLDLVLDWFRDIFG